jgi:hypothetical protein
MVEFFLRPRRHQRGGRCGCKNFENRCLPDFFRNDSGARVEGQTLRVAKSRTRKRVDRENRSNACSDTLGSSPPEMLDGTVVVRFGPREVARWAPGSLPAPKAKNWNAPFPVSPSEGKPGRAGSPHAARHAGGSPHKRGCRPPCESPRRPPARMHFTLQTGHFTC